MTSTTPETVLALRNVSKRFGAVQALSDMSMECRAGEIHAVLGENGSGKSTLLGIASGFLAPDEGTVEIAGERLHAGNASEALRLGLGMAYQTYAQVLELSVAENLYLACPAEHRGPFGRMNAWARDWLAQFGIHVDPSKRMGSIPLGDRQLVEIARALLSRPRVLLLDEPTTALGPEEVEHLHQLVFDQAAAGVGVVYVSHRMPEVLEIAHRITVLRDGLGQGTHDVEGKSEDDLISLMIGRSLQLAFPPRDEIPADTPVVLSVESLRSRRFGPVDLQLRAGEILGIAGAEGNGQNELLRALAGVDRSSGKVRVAGGRVPLRSPVAGLRAGIVLLSGERLRESLVPVLGVRANATAQVISRFSRGGLLRRGHERATVTGLVRNLKIRTPSVEQPVRFLSGGNQQKVALTRPFLRDVKVVLADEPTQGVDVASRFDIYEALRGKTREGVTMLVKSSDPLELAGLCDRVVVMSRGRVVDEIAAGDLSERRITEGIVRASGHQAHTAAEPDPDAAPDAGAAAPRPAANEAAVEPRVRTVPGWLALAMMTALMLGIGAYAATRTGDFLSEFNLNTLLGSSGALPLALVAMGQVNALGVKGFDVSVGALMTLTVVVASHGVLTTDAAWWVMVLGSIGLLGLGIVVGLINAALIRVLKLPSIVATLASLSVMQGIALQLRPEPGGEISVDVQDALNTSVGFMPVAFVGVVVLAILWDVWLYRSSRGLASRAVGHDEISSRRIGINAGWVNWRAFVLSSAMALAAGFFLAAQVGIGDARVGSGYALTSIAAAVLGGASLRGGRGSFVGAVVGAVFLSLITNILPLPNILPGFLQDWANALGFILIGVLTLLALLLYQSPELIARVRVGLENLRRAPVEPAEATAAP